MTNIILEMPRFFRRRMPRRMARKFGPKVMHLPSSMGNAVPTSTSMTFFAANAGAYVITGTALTTARESLSNREQENTVGSSINSIIFDVSIQPGVGIGGVLEYVLFKIERAAAVPVSGTGLPTDANINTLGLQAAFRTVQPGRVLKFGLIPFTADTTTTRTLKGAYAKFRMSKIRTGDFYGIHIFNRSAQTVVIGIQARYNEVK